MTFVPEGRDNADEGNGFRRRAGLIKLEEDPVEIDDEDTKFI